MRGKGDAVGALVVCCLLLAHCGSRGSGVESVPRGVDTPDVGASLTDSRTRVGETATPGGASELDNRPGLVDTEWDTVDSGDGAVETTGFLEIAGGQKDVLDTALDQTEDFDSADDLLEVLDSASVQMDTVDPPDAQMDTSDSADICTPTCDDKECGADGCGGSCGECADMNLCTSDSCALGQCLYVASGVFMCGEGEVCVGQECMPAVYVKRTVAAGGGHTCAIASDLTVWCWGFNEQSQVGVDPALLARVPIPMLISGIAEVKSVATGTSHTCAFSQKQGTFCWGRGWHGALGNGQESEEATPQPVNLGGTVDQLSLHHDRTCALTGDGSLWCWGDSPLGDGTLNYSTIPLSIDVPAVVQSVGVGFSHTCVLDENGSVWCWGYDFDGQLGLGPWVDAPLLSPASVPTIEGAVDLSVGGLHSCVVDQDGGVLCWGSNEMGQLGPNAPFPVKSNVPVSVPGLPPIMSVSVGDLHSCAVDQDGEVWCWGCRDYFSAQFADLSGNSSLCTTPNKKDSIDPVVGVSVGGGFACARFVDGSLGCWGNAGAGQLTEGPVAQTWDSYFVDLPWFEGEVATVGAGEDHTCALLSTGATYCWGNNSHGQLGTGGQTDWAVPILAGAIPPLASLATRAHHNCAVSLVGEVLCWGRLWSTSLDS